jgi:hypothetical protein
MPRMESLAKWMGDRQKGTSNAHVDVNMVIAAAYAGVPFDKAHIKRFDRRNIPVPCSWIVAKPHMRYHSLAVCKLKAGKDTAITYTRPGQAEFGDDIQTQQQGATVTYHSRTVCHKPQNVFWIDDAYINGYRGGNSWKAYGASGTKYAPNKRMYRSDNDDDGSVFFLLVPYGFACDFARVSMDVRGSHGALNDAATSGDAIESHYPTAAFYKNHWRWQSANFMKRWFTGSGYVSDHDIPNFLTHEGGCQYWDAHSKKFGGGRYDVAPKGHWSATRPGVARYRRGDRMPPLGLDTGLVK